MTGLPLGRRASGFVQVAKGLSINTGAVREAATAPHATYLAGQNFASWNRVISWLRAVDELRRAA
jgi:hypothetical protein